MKYVIHNPSTGRIVSVIDAAGGGAPPDGHVRADGNVVLYGDGDPETQMVSGGKILDRNASIVALERRRRKWQRVREKRFRLFQTYVDTLSGARWEAMTDEQKAEIRAYRQALLDLPKTTTDPDAVVWPTPPNL